MSKSYHLDARPENLFWGYFDSTTPAVIEVDSGDEVTLDCLPACLIEDLPAGHVGVLPEHLAALAAHDTRRGPGPHFMTGPVFVRNAEPGDVLQVDILETMPLQDWGFTSILPWLGALPDEMTNYQNLYVSIDRNAHTCTMPWGLTMPLEPFFGVMAVAPPTAWGRIGSPQPRGHGGNMDNKELQAGTTLYLPVHQPGALFSAGDGHGRQGDGEVSIAALETSLRGRFRLTVRKDMQITGPFAENANHLISMGFHETLDEAMRRAVRQMIGLASARAGINQDEAYMLLSLAGDLRITQVVDGEKGVHMMMRKDWLTKPAR